MDSIHSTSSNDYIDIDAYLRDETSVWASEVKPNHVGYFVYIFIVPIFCVFGIIANAVNAIIFSRPRMVSSSYIYFTGMKFYSSFPPDWLIFDPLNLQNIVALSCLDFLSCLLLFASCLARTAFRTTMEWRRFDLFCFLPISGITTTASNFLTMAVVIGKFFLALWKL